MLLLANAQSAQQCGGIAFCRVSAHLGKLILQFGHPDAVFICEVGLAVQGLTLLHDLPHGGVTHQYRVEHCFLIILEMVLAQYAQALAWSQFHCSFTGFQFSADGFQQGGFACAVGAYHSIDVAVGELHVDVLVEDAFAELNGDVA